MSILRISAPAGGAVAHVSMSAGQNLAFDFDLSAAQFSLEGKDLVITVGDSGSIVLDNFSALPKADLPEFTLADGTLVQSADYLSAINPDLVTAAGPAAGSAPSGGAGEYGDDAGALVSGVDRLSSLGSDQWTRGTEAQTPVVQSAALTPEAAEVQALAAVAPAVASMESQSAGSPVVPFFTLPVAPTPPAPMVAEDGEYVSRAVLYKTGSASGNSIIFDVLQNGQPVTGVAPDSVSISSANNWPNSYFDLAHSNYDPDTGRVTLTLTAAGKAALAAEKGANLYDYVTVTVGGQTYNMQLVVNKTGTFDSAAENGLESGGFHLQPGLTEVVWGEWHFGDKDTLGGQMASGGGHDIVFFKSDTGTAFDKQSFNAGDGDNTVTITGEKGVSGGSITTGAGQDHIDISGGNDNKTHVGISGNATLSTGAGDDTIKISGFYGMAGASATSGASIDSGSGDDSVTVSGSMAGGGIGIRLAGIDTGTGKDTVNISGNLGMDSSTITLRGDQGNTVTITGGTDNAMQKSTLNTGDGDDVVRLSNNMDATAAVMDYGSTVNLGGGHDTLTIEGYKAGTGSFINADADDTGDTITLRSQQAWQGGSINLGGGDDTLDIRTENSGALNGASGGFDHSVINMGGGKDVVTISGTTDGVSQATLNAGKGDGAGDTIGDTYEITGRAGRGMVDGTLNAGDGSDAIIITGATLALGAGEMGGSTLNAGGGNDTITLTGGTGGISDSVVNAGAGDDAITLAAGGTGLYRGIINAGDGDDTVIIKADGVGLTNHAADYVNRPDALAAINLGEGDNTLVMEAGGSLAVNYSHITSGSGADNITLISHSTNAFNVGSGVDTGAGNDTLNIDYHGDLGAAKGVASSISLGDGSDILMLSSKDGTGNLPNTNITISGGDGHDGYSSIQQDGEIHVTVGDILGFSHNLADLLTNTAAPASMTAAKFMPNVSGFEALMVDYSDGGSDSVNLDSLLSAVDKLKDTNGDMTSIIIKGEAGDAINMGAHNATQVAEGVHIDGVEGAFTQHTVTHGEVEMQIFIQSTFN